MKRILLSLLLLVGMATTGLAQTPIIMGDMNRDGEITIADVTGVVNTLLGKTGLQYITRNDFGQPVTGITLNMAELTLTADGTATLEATVIPVNATEHGVTWTSSNPAVATVTPGECELFLVSYGSSKVAVIKAVQAITGWGLAESKAFVEGTLPASLGTFDAATAAEYKANLETAGGTASLMEKGSTAVVTGIANGTAFITATTIDGGYMASCVVTVGSSGQEEHQYVHMGEGHFWATMNVGASSPEDTGDYFAWGETEPKADYSWATYKWGSSETKLTKYVLSTDYGTVDNKSILEPADDAATVNWGEDWCTPTEDDWNWLWTHSSKEAETLNGVKGIRFTSTVDGCTSNSIFLPCAGVFDGTAVDDLYDEGIDNCAVYWSSTLYSTSSDAATAFNWTSYYTGLLSGIESDIRYRGLLVRPVNKSSNVGVRGIELSANSMEMELGQTFFPYLSATVLPSSASNKTIRWFCSDESVVTVTPSGTTQCYLAAQGPGQAVITVTTVEGGFAALCTVTVRIPVTGVSLDQTALTINKGSEAALIATIAPENATNKQVTWSSSNTSVATVSASGIVTGVGRGSATITATTVDGGYTATCAVTVKIPTIGVYLNQTTLTIKKGRQATLTATVLPADAENKQVTWSSSDTSVATVSASGVVTGVGEGTAIITVTTVDDGYTATCTVTVPSNYLNGHEFVEMADGLKWATMNIGANSPEDVGDLYAWAEIQTKSEYSKENYYYNQNYSWGDNRVLLPEDDVATVKWGDGWRMPTYDEWQLLLNRRLFTWTWTYNNGTGVKGYTVTSKVSGYEGNQIFLPAEEINHWLGEYSGNYWSSSLHPEYDDVGDMPGSEVYRFFYAWALTFESNYVELSKYNQYFGCPVRAVAE